MICYSCGGSIDSKVFDIIHYVASCMKCKGIKNMQKTKRELILYFISSMVSVGIDVKIYQNKRCKMLGGSCFLRSKGHQSHLNLH